MKTSSKNHYSVTKLYKREAYLKFHSEELAYRMWNCYKYKSYCKTLVPPNFNMLLRQQIFKKIIDFVPSKTKNFKVSLTFESLFLNFHWGIECRLKKKNQSSTVIENQRLEESFLKCKASTYVSGFLFIYALRLSTGCGFLSF